jgi:Fe-S-cluster containining protein
MLLYKNLVSRGRWTPSLKATFEEHASKVRDASYEVWLLSMIPCPLLDEGTKKCTVYNARPFQCRVTYSTGDPYNCHPHRILESEIVNKRDVTEEFHSRVNRAIRKHGITTIIMPLSVAVLVGEKISNGEYDLDGADMAIFKDYVENT